ncbi:MAG: hypothetical protein OXD36_05820 [Rhodobacter sp.]|nr:hypothetical protein [Rhodobacter sp.]
MTKFRRFALALACFLYAGFPVTADEGNENDTGPPRIVNCKTTADAVVRLFDDVTKVISFGKFRHGDAIKETLTFGTWAAGHIWIEENRKRSRFPLCELSDAELLDPSPQWFACMEEISDVSRKHWDSVHLCAGEFRITSDGVSGRYTIAFWLERDPDGEEFVGYRVLRYQ